MKSAVLKIFQEDPYDEPTQKIMEEFQNEYFQNGWRLMSRILKCFIIFVITSGVVFLSPESSFYWRAVYVYPLLLLLILVVDRFDQNNKKIAEMILIFNMLASGSILITINIRRPTYFFNENWMNYVLYSLYVGCFFFMKWKKIVACFYIVMIAYVIAMNLKYDDVPFALYVSVIFTCLIYPITLIFISQKIKEMIILLKTKKDLIHTIRSILQVFPEGVIIRSVDPVAKQTVIKFANDVASQFLGRQADSEISDELRVKLDSPDQSHDDERLEEFLQEQELKIDTDQFACGSQMVEIKECKRRIEEVKQYVRDIDSEQKESNDLNSKFYSIKSIKVQWDNNNSFMHVFINTTQVKKLEEERANREYQLLMFTNLSHDMRTPLNAIINSLKLSNMIVNEMKKKLTKYHEANSQCQPLFVRFERFIQIGEISSMLLVNLIDDILDMAKFKANMFKLIETEFILSSLLTELDFLFGFQCVERHLRFDIACDPDLAGTTFAADSKRIKQVLINLISNSVKFTERGSITVAVDRFEQDNETVLGFTVRDTGVGINQSDIPKLFSKFGMLQKHIKMNACGSGIGLSISKMIVESLGGNICVESEEDRWTEFKFTVKCTEVHTNKREEELKISNQNKYVS